MSLVAPDKKGDYFFSSIFIMDYSKYKTDKERAAVAHLVPPQHYSTLLEWEDEATDTECKDILHHYAWRAFHIETM